MPKNRQGRINEEVRNALSEALRSIKDPRVSGIVSILRCEVTNDMRYCKMYVSVMGSDEEQQDAIKGLKSASGFLRHELAEKVSLRYTPQIVVVHENSISYGVKISKIINGFTYGSDNGSGVSDSVSLSNDGRDEN